MSEKEFWQLNLKELNALIERKSYLNKNEKKIEDYRAGIIASTIANVYSEKRYKPEDFMPKEKKKQTWKEQLKFVEILNTAFGGNDKRGGAK